MVAYDSVGPAGGAGAGQASGGTLTWTHTTAAGSTTILAACTLDVNGADTMAATCDSVAMSPVGSRVYTSGGSSLSFLQVWSIAGIGAGAHTIAVTETGGGVVDMVAGSIAFSAAGTLGTPVTSSADSTPSVVIPGAAASSVIAGFIAAGATISATTAPSVSRFVDNFEGSSGGNTGNIAGATSAGTGSSVTMAWTCSSTSMCLLAVEVKAAAGGAPRAVTLNRQQAVTTAATR